MAMSYKFRNCVRLIVVGLLLTTMLTWNKIRFQQKLFYCDKHCSPLLKTEENKTKIHLITNYALMYEPPWNQSQTENSMERMQERQIELEETLQRNLNHYMIGSVHVIVNQEKAEKRLIELDLFNKHKLHVGRIETMPTFKDFFQYIRDDLLNRIVVLTNMDIYLGEGFEKLNHSLFLKYKVIYVLTRHGRREERCDMFNKPRYCGTGKVVSHDTYVLLPQADDFNQNILNEMNYPMNLMKAEYRLAWIFKNLMNRKLVNPCKLLKTYHNHCINIHGKHRPSIEKSRKRLLKVSPANTLLP
ncbi:uncharacterized protein LOC124457686 isoform X2 [Xenia sp. Carnegie-2017]|nr:uncharacterized protein LOC124457686 isoform X2 [Xenia sp. Carnegie-2017]XP_046863848.1 uncharacterized protein LOC124457686 isoform X2 [Xenia sp. Carnegie-2017]